MGLKPFHTPLGVMLDEKNPTEESLHPLQHLRRLPVSGECESRRAYLLRRAGVATPECHAAHRRQSDTPAKRAHPAAKSRRVEVERNGAKETYSAKSLWFPVARSIPPRCCCARRTTNIQTAWPMARMWSAGITWVTSNSVLMALSKCPNPTVFQKTLSVNDFYFGSPEWEFPMGHISFVGKLDGDTLKAGAPKVAPKWTLDLMGKHSLDFWLTSEDLPDPNNRVTINRDGEIVLQYKPNNEEGHKRLIKKLEGLMQQQTKCSVHGHECHEGLVRAQSVSRPAHSASPAWRTRTARFVLETIQKQARSIATAKRTSSTIFMLSMEASSVRVAP